MRLIETMLCLNCTELFDRHLEKCPKCGLECFTSLDDWVDVSEIREKELEMHNNWLKEEIMDAIEKKTIGTVDAIMWYQERIKEIIEGRMLKKAKEEQA